MIRLFFRLLKWLFTTIGPYLVGITVGVGFAYWLVSHYADQSDASETWRLVAGKVNSFIAEIRSTETGASAPAQAAPAAPAQVAQTAPAAPAAPPPPPPEPAPLPMPESAPLAAEPVAATPPVAAEPPPPVMASEPLAPLPPPLPVEPPLTAGEQGLAAVQPPTAPMPNWNAPPAMPAAPAPAAQNDPCSGSKNPAQFHACQWQRNCMANLEQSRVMVTEGKQRCAQAGYAAQNCLAYYQMLETRLNAQNCIPPANGGVSYWPNP